MKIKYSKHSVDRMFQRNMTTEDVELILNEPDGKIRQSRDKYIYYKRFKGRKDNSIAAVTVIRHHKIYEIVTVMINFEVK